MGIGTSSGLGARQPLAEINMIPLIDVMLVLLIVFIITAPLLTHAVRIDLPQASSEVLPQSSENIQLGIRENGELYWNAAPITTDILEQRLAEAAKSPVQPELHIYADARTPYETIANVMASAARSGLSKMRFASLPGR